VRRPTFSFQLSAFCFPTLCGCADPQRCHRALAADFLAGRLGAPVVHLFAPPRAPRDDGGQLTLPGL
jgi:hypothetical protein